MSHCSEFPVLLASGNDTLAAFLHLPPTPQRVVLLLPPLAEERKACQRIMCDLARHLAQRQAAVLRFDYRGTADSSGAFHDFSCADWLADAAAAHAWLARHFDNQPPIIIGIRLGATLATRLTAPCGGRILIAPLDGEAWLRQLLQRNQVNQMVAFGKAHTTRAAIEQKWRQGADADLDGYLFTPRLAADLATLTPVPTNAPGTVITIGGGAAPACAANLEHIPLRLPAFWNAVGHVDVAPLTAAVATAVDACHPPQTVAVTLTPPDEHSSASADAPPDNSAPVAIPTANGVLRAWLDRPAGHPRQRILFLHGWSGDRSGPHRMFTTFSRQLAATGTLSLRIDLAGRGESETTTNEASIAAMTQDAQAALQWLRANHGADGPLLIAAICSGCKVAITAAAASDDIAALLLWSAESMGSLRNPSTGARKTAAMLKAYAVKLLRRETWRKIITGRVQGSIVAKALSNSETRSAAEAVAEDATMRRFQRFTGRLLFIYGGSDPDASGSAAAYAAFCRRHGIAHQLHTIAHAGHSFYNRAWEAQVLQHTKTFLDSIATNPTTPPNP